MSVTRGAIAIAVASFGFAAVAQQSGMTGIRQQTGAASRAASPAASPAQPRPTVDESALRYFASQGDSRRVDAEIARLRALYPEWSPPADLSQLTGTSVVVSDPALDAMWELYAEGKTAEIRAAIAERQTSDPQWRPPAELLAALEQAEARKRLTNASDGGQWRTVLTVATETPSLLTCANMDVLWRVAEAFAKTDQISRTNDLYVYTLTNCNNPAERLGTLQKAVSLLPETDVTALLKFERTTANPPDDFSTIRDELARRRVERASIDDKTTASPEDLAVVERLAEDTADFGNALILGYYNYHRKNTEKALEWFKRALDRKAGPKAAEGYALSLRDLNRFVEAEAFAYEWRDKAKENMQVYLDVATALLSQDPPPRLEARVIARVIAAVSAERHASGAQAVGWYSYNTGQIRSARDWFLQSLEWKPDEEPAAYGVALATQRLKDRAGFAAIVSKWRARSPRIADLAEGRTTPASRRAADDAAAETTAAMAAPARREVAAVEDDVAPRRAYSRGDARANVRRGKGCSMTQSPEGLSAPAALNLGWCLMELNRPMEAANAFDVAVKRGAGKTREEAAYGKTLAYLRKNLTAEAAVAAAEAPQNAERRRELTASILSQRALGAYRDGRWAQVILTLGERSRIVPEQTDLMMLRGWSYFQLGRYKDAERIFRAVQRTGSSDEAGVGLNAIMEKTQNVRQ